MARLFNDENPLLLSEEAYKEALRAFVGHFQTQGEFDGVIAIGRGGLRFGRDLSDLLVTRYLEVFAKINHNDEINQAGEGQVEIPEGAPEPFLILPPKCRIILADDIVGTGKTIRAVSNLLSKARSDAVFTTATLCRNAGSDYVPDVSAWQVKRWIVFPWEPTQHQDATKLRFTNRLLINNEN